MDQLVVFAGALGGLGGVLTALVTYAVARRRTSGGVGTSEADALWAESQAMRKDLRDEVAKLREELWKCRDRLEQIEAKAT